MDGKLLKIARLERAFTQRIKKGRLGVLYLLVFYILPLIGGLGRFLELACLPIKRDIRDSY